MARRSRMDEEYQEPGAGRYPRRRSNNQALWIALGGALVVGLVFIFIVMGSTGGESYKLEARNALEGFLKVLLENKYRNSLGRLHLEGMLTEYNPGALKTRDEWTPEKRQEVELDLYRNLRTLLENELHIESSVDIRRKVLDRAEYEWDSYHDEVKIRWTTEPFERIIAERRLRVPAQSWVATMIERDGKWLVARFGMLR